MLENYLNLISSGCQDLVREALWGLSNIAAGSTEQVKDVIGSPNLVQKVLGLAMQ